MFPWMWLHSWMVFLVIFSGQSENRMDDLGLPPILRKPPYEDVSLHYCNICNYDSMGCDAFRPCGDVSLNPPQKSDDSVAVFCHQIKCHQIKNRNIRKKFWGKIIHWMGCVCIYIYIYMYFIYIYIYISVHSLVSSNMAAWKIPELKVYSWKHHRTKCWIFNCHDYRSISLNQCRGASGKRSFK